MNAIDRTPLWLRRCMVVFLLPVAIVYAFLVRLFSEVRSAFWFAWNDVRGEIDVAKQYWRRRDG